MAGQAVHFRRYAPQEIFYAIARYTDEVNRLYGVMNTRLARHEFLAGRYSIADMAAVGWVRLAERQGQNLDDFPHLKRWFETIRRAARRQARLRHPRRGGFRGRYARCRKCAPCCSASARGERGYFARVQVWVLQRKAMAQPLRSAVLSPVRVKEPE